jgi:hypothetical protein
MRRALFLLLRLICDPALAALAVIWVNGQCPRFDEIGVTCATRFSQALADFGLAVALFSATTGIPAIPALGGVVLMVRRVAQHQRQAALPKSSALLNPTG